MTKTLSLLLLFVSGTLAAGQDITLPSTLSAKTGRLGSITVKSTAKSIAWAIVPPGDIDFFREFDSDPTVTRLRFLPYRDGQYSLVVAGATGDKVSQVVCVITSVGAGPPPPPPPPPPPLDAFTLAVQAAYTADGGRPSQIDALLSVFKSADTLTAGAKTLKDAIASLHTATALALTDSELVSTRQVIAQELNKAFGGSDSGVTNFNIDGSNRAKVSAQFARVAAVLTVLK